MRPLHTVTAGQQIRVSYPSRVGCDATVLLVETPDSLPSIGATAELVKVRAILAGRAIQQLALIEHLRNRRPVCLFILGDGSGQWWDLQDQALLVEGEGAEAASHA